MKKMLVLGLTALMTMGTVISGSVMVSAEENSSADAILEQEPSGVKIVVGTNNGSDGRDVWLSELAKKAGYNIEIVGIGAGDLTARVISEVNNPTINVVWGPSESQFLSMIEAGALAEFTPDWADKIGDVSEENGYSWSYEIQPKVFVCNPDEYNEDNAPKSIKDLWEKEEFHGKYRVANNFAGATDRAVIALILTQYLDESGELGVSQEGWDALKQYYDNGYKTPDGENDYENMASGKTPITFTFASGIQSKNETFEVEPFLAYLEEGEPTNTNQIGVVACQDSDVLEESMRFANWLGGAETMGEYAESGSMVANEDAQDKMTNITKEVQQNYRDAGIDWNYVNSMMDEWIAKIQFEIY